MPDKMTAWPARMDVLQSLSGLLLTLFIWAHMFFESSILLGKDAMYWVSQMFEGVHLFGKPYPILVSVAAAAIFLLIAVHAALAMRKFPGNYRQYRAYRRHMKSMQHSDTSLWFVQAVTGFALFFLASAHLVVVMVQPDNIGPYASADRIWSGRFWLLYAPLLFVAHLHAGIGFYRLVMKWGPLPGRDTAALRRRTRIAMRAAVAFFLCLGSISLATYMYIGHEHSDQRGERYVPGSTLETGRDK